MLREAIRRELRADPPALLPRPVFLFPSSRETEGVDFKGHLVPFPSLPVALCTQVKAKVRSAEMPWELLKHVLKEAFFTPFPRTGIKMSWLKVKEPQ